MNTNHPLNHQLLDEYGLNEVTYRLLVKVVYQPGPLTWQGVKFFASHERITGNPAPSMRKLVDRGLVIGPARHQDIDVRPFVATQSGYNLLKRIERGLRRPEWITFSRANALKWLSNGVGYDADILRPRGISITTLRALEKAGYLESQSGKIWHITELGREAWAEWQKKEASS